MAASFSSVIFRTFSLSLTLFFAFSLRHLESQIDIYVKGHHVYKDIWTPEIGVSLDVQIELNNPLDKYSVCIRKSGKVVGHLRNEQQVDLQKQYYFSWKMILISRQKTITSRRRWNLGDGEGFSQTKACWSSKVYRLIARWAYPTEKNLS